MTRLLSVVFFIAGLAVPCWIGAGYLGSNPLALAMTTLIAVVYLVGAWELYRYHQATVTLSGALSGLTGPVAQLDDWLAKVETSLRSAVRLRIRGERNGLPGPTLAPYLVGLLVLLGMLGTFLGMVATLRGTGLALEGATDLQAIRASLAAPVKGLGLAFGTSVAGVASSAMLGLLSALSRRERLLAAQVLDSQIATQLYRHTPAYQRDENLLLLQRQAEVMPQVADRLQALAQTLEQRVDTLSQTVTQRVDQLSTTWEQRSDAVVAALTQNSQAIGETLAQRSQVLGETLTQGHQALGEVLAQRSQTLDEQLLLGQTRFHEKAEAAYVQLSASVASALKDGLAEGARAAGAAVEPIAQSTLAGMAREASALHEAVGQALQQQLAGLGEQAQGSAAAVAQTWREALSEHRQATETQANEMRNLLGAYADTLAQRSTTALEGVSTRLDATTQAMTQAWQQAFEAQAQTGRQLAVEHQSALTQAAQALAQQGAALVSEMGQTHGALRAQLAEADEKRLSTWAASLETAASDLRQTWQHEGEANLARQQQICAALQETAETVSQQTREQAGATMAQLQQLAQSMAQAPQAAADAVTEVRQKLSDSLARDNAMLEERARLMDTLGTLLDAVNHASTEQRKAVDELIETSSQVLQRVGLQFTEQVQSETGKLTGVAEHVVSSTAGLSGLGEAFGQAVQAFGTSNEALMTQLQRIEQALDKSLARSDEQLAYYVAQAREVVDLSMLSQKQIIEELRQLGGPQTQHGAGSV